MVFKLLRILPRVGLLLAVCSLFFGLGAGVSRLRVLEAAWLCVFHGFMTWMFWDLKDEEAK